MDKTDEKFTEKRNGNNSQNMEKTAQKTDKQTKHKLTKKINGQNRLNDGQNGQLML